MTHQIKNALLIYQRSHSVVYQHLYQNVTQLCLLNDHQVKVADNKHSNLYFENGKTFCLTETFVDIPRTT